MEWCDFAQRHGNGIAVDGAGSAYVTGHTTSTNFPTQSPYQATLGEGALCVGPYEQPAPSVLPR